MQNCKECGFQFRLLSQRFYCCDSSESVCSVCRRKVCKICKKSRTNEIIIPKCDKCYCRLYENDLLFQYSCEKYFCSKCLSGIFMDAYKKVAIEKRYDQKDGQLYAKLYCGHQYPYYELLGFFQHFCLGCGRQYDSTLDYEFNDGVKLCSVCYVYFSHIFQSAFIQCELCQQLIKNSSQASIIEDSDVAICQKCTSQSQIQEKLISESKKNLKQEKKVEDNLIKQQKLEQPKKISQPEAIQQPKVTKSPLNKLFKKPSISELKKKQSTRQSNNKSPKLSITSRFSNNFEDIDEQTSKALRLSPSVKLKKQLSNQTVVEQYAIEIPENVAKLFVHCKRCNVQVPARIAFDLYHPGSKVSLKGSLVEFSSVKTASSLSSQNQYNICRVCYNKSSERQKLLLEISSNNLKSEMNNRPSKLQDTEMDYLKVGKSSRRQIRSPSPSPFKEYSLTGSKQQIATKEIKQQLLNSTHTSNKPSPKQYKKDIVHPVSGQIRHTIHSNPHKFMKCDLCRDVKKSLIATMNQGYLCDECFYKKDPRHSSFLFN